MNYASTNNTEEIHGTPLFFTYADGGFTSVDWSSLPYTDAEPVWDNGGKGEGIRGWGFVVGAKPADYTRVWTTVGAARQGQTEAQKPLMTFSEFVNAVAAQRGITGLEVMEEEHRLNG